MSRKPIRTSQWVLEWLEYLEHSTHTQGLDALLQKYIPCEKGKVQVHEKLIELLRVV